MKTDNEPTPLTEAQLQARLLALGARLPSLAWWFTKHRKLGCSPRDAVDSGRISEVEALLELVKAKT